MPDFVDTVDSPVCVGVWHPALIMKYYEGAMSRKVFDSDGRNIADCGLYCDSAKEPVDVTCDKGSRPGAHHLLGSDRYKEFNTLTSGDGEHGL